MEADITDLRQTNEKLNGNLREALGETAQMRISDSAMKDHLSLVNKDLRDKETEVRDMSVQIATKNNLIE